MRFFRGIHKINNYLNNWLRAHDFDCTVCYDVSFSYDVVNGIINYTFMSELDDDDRLYAEMCEKIRPELQGVDDFILSFFHELGHHCTRDKFSIEEWSDYDDIVNKYSDDPNITLEQEREYYNLPIEYAATEWSCNYIADHVQEVNEFLREVSKLLKEFIELNYEE